MSVIHDLRPEQQAERERQRLEVQLRQSQKLQAIGQLAGGIVHDFNNLINVITAVAEVLQDELLAMGAKPPPELEGFQRTAERTAALARQLLGCLRRRDREYGAVHLNPLLRALCSLLERLLPPSIRTVCLFEEPLWEIEADAGEIEPVVLNLVVNAGDAMPSGGTLVVRTANVVLDAAAAACFGSLGPGAYVLTVGDSGQGIDEQTRARIFDPFFTTKAESTGTGLGLAMVHDIVTECGGGVRCMSEPAIGTSFEIALPRRRPPSLPPALASS